MTGQKSVAELVVAARKLEAGTPSMASVVLAEVRSAGFGVRKGEAGVHRFIAPLGLGRGEPRVVGLLVDHDGVVTYAEWANTVYPQWAGWSQAENDASIRALLLAIRDDQR